MRADAGMSVHVNSSEVARFLLEIVVEECVYEAKLVSALPLRAFWRKRPASLCAKSRARFTESPLNTVLFLAGANELGAKHKLKQHSKLLSTKRKPLLVLLYCGQCRGPCQIHPSKPVLPQRPGLQHRCNLPSLSGRESARIGLISDACCQCAISAQPLDRPYSSAQGGHLPLRAACTSINNTGRLAGRPAISICLANYHRLVSQRSMHAAVSMPHTLSPALAAVALLTAAGPPLHSSTSRTIAPPRPAALA